MTYQEFMDSSLHIRQNKVRRVRTGLGSDRREIKLSVITRSYVPVKNVLLMNVCLAQSGKALQVSERIRTMAASASVLSNLFTSFSTSGDSMYCNRERDNRLCSISSTSQARLRTHARSHTHLHTPSLTNTHTHEVAAGHMPRSTLVIKTEGTKSIWLSSASSRFIPKTK